MSSRRGRTAIIGVLMVGLGSSGAAAGATKPAIPSCQEPDGLHAPAPTVPESSIPRRAHVGATKGYGRKGVLELGGSAGFGAASNYTQFELSPSIGVFLVDNVQLSVLTAINYMRVSSAAMDLPESATELRALLEPSVHVPFSPAVFGFAGLGAGVNYIAGHGGGIALQPRLGVQLMVGRSGILTPAFAVNYSTAQAIRAPSGRLLGVTAAYGLNVGYTVVW
jgi:hypothetical protein